MAYQGIKDGATTTWDFDSSSCQSIAGTYTDLGSNGTAITTNFYGSAMTYDDDNSSVQNIGFNFSYNGTVYTQFVLNTNGYIKLGAAPSSLQYFYPAYNGSSGGTITASDIDIIYPYNHDLKGGSGTPEYRVYTSGSTGSRVCTIQFKNVADKLAPTQYTNMNFQVKLYEETGAIEFIYGTWTASANASTAITAACGIKGINANETVNVAKLSSSAWNASMSNPANYDFTEDDYPTAGPQFNTRNANLPDAGRTYRFKPNNIQVKAIADSYLRDGSPYGDTNYGTDTVLTLKKDVTVGFSRIDYLKFKIPAQARGTVTDAKLQLYINFANTDANTTQWQLYKVANNSWTETGITYNNRPAYSTLLSTITGSNTTGNHYWDITSTVQGMTSDTLSLALVSTNTGAATNVNFSSKESAVATNRPAVIITSGVNAARTASAATTLIQLQQSLTGISVYPNPAKNYIHITTGNNKNISWQLFSASGQLLLKRTMKNNNEQVDISSYNNGIYYLELRNKEQASIQKIIINR